MTADHSKKPIFDTFPILHISHPNVWIFTFSLSSGHLVMIFIILEGFSESQKNWSFRPPWPCRKMVSFAIFTFFAYFSLKSVKIYILVVLWSTSDDLFLKTFQKVEKIDVFNDCGPLEKVSFYYFPNCIFLVQMSEFLHFSCPFFHLLMIFVILECFPGSRKKWIFRPPWPCRKIVNFVIFTFSLYFSSKSVKFYI